MPTDEEIHYHMVKSKKLKFPEPRKEPDQYARPIGPEKPSTLERITGATNRVINNPYVSGAVGAVKKRAGEIAHESRETPARERREHRGGRRRESYDPPMGGVPQMPSDPFGVGGYGGFMHEQRAAPSRGYNDTPRKKKRRRRRYASAEPSGPDMFGIPKGLRHLF